MRRQQLKMAGLILTLAVLVAAVLFLKAPYKTGQAGTDEAVGSETMPDQTEGKVSVGSGRTLLWSGAGTQIEEISVETADGTGEAAGKHTPGSYRIVRQESGYTILDFPEGRLDSGKLEEALGFLTEAEVSEDLGEQAEIDQFGLGDQSTRFMVSGKDGTARQFQIGNMLAGSEDRRYALIEGSVCVVDGFPQSLCAGPRAFYRLELIAAPERQVKDPDTEAVYVFDYLNISGSRFGDGEQIHIVRSEETDSGYLMESPAYGAAMFAETDSAVQTVSIPDSLARVEAAAVIYESAGEKELQECGLEEPYAVAEYALNGEEHILRVSSVRNGMRYLTVDDDPAVYEVEDGRVSPWAEVRAGDLRTSYIWLVDVAGLDRLVLDGESGRHEYRLERRGGDNGSGFRVYYGDKELDAGGEWLSFYQTLLGMPILSTDRPSGWEEEPDYSVSYYCSGQAPVAVTFHREHDSGRYAALLNGRFAGVLRTDTVEEAVKSADRVNADGESR